MRARRDGLPHLANRDEYVVLREHRWVAVLQENACKKCRDQAWHRLVPHWRRVAIPGRQHVARSHWWARLCQLVGKALQYLTSWDGMGAAGVACVHGCRCAPTIIDARILEGNRISVDTSFDLPVTPSLACQLEVTNLGAQGVAAKWKLTAVQVGWKASQE